MTVIEMRVLETLCHQLPRIADALELIAKALEQKDENQKEVK